jgi:type IV pilus assembly protein PilV
MSALLVMRRQLGISLIEVMVTLLILAIGLLGMAALQWRLQQSEMEAYQRSQALLLVNDMAQRMTINRNAAGDYVTGLNALGVDAPCPVPAAGAPRAEVDLFEWCEALQGASETIGNNNVGAMIGGRGCVEDLGGNRYMITVAWQGLLPLAAPPASVECGVDEYDTTAVCEGDLCRRAVTTLVQVGVL